MAQRKKISKDFKARHRAKRELPSGLKFLSLMNVFVFGFGFTFLVFFIGTIWLRQILHPDIPWQEGPDIAFLMAFIASFAAGMPLGLMAGNFMLWSIPPIRKGFDSHYAGVSGASFREAMGGLAKVARYTVPIGGLLILGCAFVT